MPYLKSWEESVHKREGYTPQAKSMMVLAKETRDGIDATGNYNFFLCSNCMCFSTQLNHL